MAEEKIAAEERSAVDQLRATAADAATRAAARLIAERNDGPSDAKLVDQAISELGRVGMVAIGNSRPEAEAVFRRTVDTIDREAGGPGGK